MKCTLCNSPKAELFENVKEKDYYKCPVCDLVFLDPQHYLDIDEEEIRYGTHENDKEDQGYADFLNRVRIPAMDFLTDGDKGLDYGCGPNPFLVKLVKNAGYDCEFYDPIFFPKEINEEYDFIFATESFEHFYSPKKELDKINEILKPGGILGIMTELNDESKDFPNWYYIIDPTHVCFYSQKTIGYICKEYGMEVLFSDNHRVIIFRKM